MKIGSYRSKIWTVFNSIKGSVVTQTMLGGLAIYPAVENFPIVYRPMCQNYTKIDWQ